ncbi:MAG: hypothetical protein Q9224_002140 [Gallowayella concinna]
MQSGYSRQSCLKSMFRSSGAKSIVRHVRANPAFNNARKRQYAHASRHSKSLPIQQRRTAATADSLNKRVYGNAPGDLRFPYGREVPIESTQGLILQPNDLFHSFSNSPLPAIRRKAAFMKSHAYCPHPDHRQTRIVTSPHDPEARKTPKSTHPPAHVNFECPDCGLPVYCSEDHWMDDYEHHSELCDTLRQANEDEHDLRSGRYFPEFEYPGPQMEEIAHNLLNWDTYLYTREYNAINEDRSMRQATRLLTYPMTIASIIHEFSPYNIRRGGRLTTEGLKSFTALRYNLHPPRSGSGLSVKQLKPTPPAVRIFILGARAESSLPREAWIQLEYLFHRCPLHLIFIGPESMMNRDKELPLPERTPANPFGGIVEDRLSSFTKITTFVEYYHTMHKANYFQPFDPYFDCFVLFHPGLGHPASAHEWAETLPQLLETKVPIISTGYTEWDMQRDKQWVEEKMAGEVDMLMEAGENRFRSLRWDLNDYDPGDISAGNWGVWAFRGKRYETEMKDGVISL